MKMNLFKFVFFYQSISESVECLGSVLALFSCLRLGPLLFGHGCLLRDLVSELLDVEAFIKSFKSIEVLQLLNVLLAELVQQWVTSSLGRTAS